jgi:hypothetical protein
MMKAHKMQPRGRPPPFIMASTQGMAPAQNGGFAIAPLVALGTAAYKAGTIIKPATKLKKILDNTGLNKSHPKIAGVLGSILSAGQSIGWGPTPQVIVVKPRARKQGCWNETKTRCKEEINTMNALIIFFLLVALN